MTSGGTIQGAVDHSNFQVSQLDFPLSHYLLLPAAFRSSSSSAALRSPSPFISTSHYQHTNTATHLPSSTEIHTTIRPLSLRHHSIPLSRAPESIFPTFHHLLGLVITTAFTIPDSIFHSENISLLLRRVTSPPRSLCTPPTVQRTRRVRSDLEESQTIRTKFFLECSRLLPSDSAGHLLINPSIFRNPAHRAGTFFVHSGFPNSQK